MKDGMGYDFKSRNAARPCAYVCINPTERECVQNGGKNQREERTNVV